MKLKAFLFGMVLFAPLCAFAGISGTYQVYGSEPNGPYGGTIVIDRQGSIYTATWTDEDGTIETGTGVRTGDVLSFVFKKGNIEAYGVQVYHVSKESLKGPWAWYGATWTGFEKLKKIQPNNCSVDR